MPARIDLIGSGAEHGDGLAAAFERASVGGSIDAFGQAAGDGVAGLGESPGEGACVRQSCRGRAARTDDGDLRRPQAGRIAGHEQRRRRIGRIPQQNRKVFAAGDDQMMIRSFEPTQIAVDGGPVGCGQPGTRFGGHTRIARGARLRGTSAAVSADRIAHATRTQAWRAQQRQPVTGFVDGQLQRHRKQFSGCAKANGAECRAVCRESEKSDVRKFYV